MTIPPDNNIDVDKVGESPWIWIAEFVQLKWIQSLLGFAQMFKKLRVHTSLIHEEVASFSLYDQFQGVL